MSQLWIGVMAGFIAGACFGIVGTHVYLMNKVDRGW